MIKISRPVQGDEFIRTRLFRRLDDLTTKQVVWIGAPAGAGKTTLVAGYAEAGKIPCLWYRMDGSDGDLASFFYHLGQAGRKAAPRRKTALPLFTSEYVMGIGVFTVRYFEELCLRLKRPCLIVFDNYQDLPSDSPLHDVLPDAFSQLPQGVRAVVISRNDPPPSFVRLRAERMIDVIGWDEMTLSGEESDAILRMRMGAGLDNESLRNIRDMAGGWVAGVTLIAEALKRKGMPAEALAGHAPEEIFDFFAREVFNGLDGSVKTFMMKTACLPRMSAAMAGELTGEVRAGKILSDMFRRNYFISESFNPDPFYEYHPLYRSFLLQRAEEDFSPELRMNTRRSAAMILERSGQTGEAVELLRDIGDWDGIAGIILSHGKDMIGQGRHLSLQHWMTDIPEDVLAGNPWLLYWKGMSFLTCSPLQAGLLFEQAYRQFRRDGDPVGAILSASGAMNAIFIGMNDYAPLDGWFASVNDLVGEIGSFPNEEIEAWVTSGMLAALGLREIVHPAADDWAERAYNLPDHPETMIPKANALHHLFWFGTMRKGLPAVDRAAVELKRMAQSRNAHPVVKITEKRVENSCHQISGMAVRCIETADEGLELSRKHGIHFFDVVFMITKAASLIDIRDISAANDVLERLSMSGACRTRHGRAAHLMYASRAALVSGEYEKALALAIELYPLVLSLDSPFGIGMGILRKALALHFLGKCNDAEEVLPEIHEIARTHDSRWLRMFALYHEAYFAFDAGDTERGTETLRESLRLAKESGYVYCTDDHPDITARLCLKAIEKGIEADYVGEIIRRRGLTPPIEGELDPVALEGWPYPVKIYTLGRFEIVRDGVPLVFSGKVQKKPLEMLKAIVAMGGSHVPVVRLTDALWPDAEGDLAHNAFEVTLSRLRKLLSCGDIITFSAGQIGLDGTRCRVDSMVLESEIDAAEAADGEKSAEHCGRALRLYRGAFLPSDEEAPWASARRAFLHDAMLRIMMQAGRYHESRGNVEQALDIYSRGIATDNLAEAFYQRRMICLRELGYRAEAVKTFHTCRRMLKDHLGLEPSKTTRAVFDSLAD